MLPVGVLYGLCFFIFAYAIGLILSLVAIYETLKEGRYILSLISAIVFIVMVLFLIGLL